ncbi:hypothetical protein M407DRAFT_29279 [Tulasnella calospora MUT 4182]|uniref:Uncharacterized protein n=1 Tax=Tulasnella calospora MUT 4182 TaxID=1051891 RepID=A0A0C3Q964_9AGAM|nr:hypothetical protein M407DRAFT_29279 [Tulasnella calospora MUT 4182]
MQPRPKHHQLQAVRLLGMGAEVFGTLAEALERLQRVTLPPNNNNNAPRRPGDLPPIPQSPPRPTNPARGGPVVGMFSAESSLHLKSPTFHYHYSRTPSEYSNIAAGGGSIIPQKRRHCTPSNPSQLHRLKR